MFLHVLFLLLDMSRLRTYRNMSRMSNNDIIDLMKSISSKEETGSEGDLDFDDVLDPNFVASEDDSLIEDDLGSGEGEILVDGTLHRLGCSNGRIY